MNLWKLRVPIGRPAITLALAADFRHESATFNALTQLGTAGKHSTCPHTKASSSTISLFPLLPLLFHCPCMACSSAMASTVSWSSLDSARTCLLSCWPAWPCEARWGNA